MNRPDDGPPFYVVQFKDKLPFESIDKYVCVPRDWLFECKEEEQETLVSYPEDEDPSVTKDRVKSEEHHFILWRIYTVVIKYTSFSYEDADSWILENTNRSEVNGVSK